LQVISFFNKAVSANSVAAKKFFSAVETKGIFG
jgi:hypothetical protein